MEKEREVMINFTKEEIEIALKGLKSVDSLGRMLLNTPLSAKKEDKLKIEKEVDLASLLSERLTWAKEQIEKVNQYEEEQS